mmetsp:Transcript_45296/g.94279  ORF Transcript_45296/g.94279 Transcript_45296/m.94279 type:complete len:395 (+) Transcript_45296:385-1569(+)
MGRRYLRQDPPGPEKARHLPGTDGPHAVRQGGPELLPDGGPLVDPRVHEGPPPAPTERLRGDRVQADDGPATGAEIRRAQGPSGAGDRPVRIGGPEGPADPAVQRGPPGTEGLPQEAGRIQHGDHRRPEPLRGRHRAVRSAVRAGAGRIRADQGKGRRRSEVHRSEDAQVDGIPGLARQGRDEGAHEGQAGVDVLHGGDPLRAGLGAPEIQDGDGPVRQGPEHQGGLPAPGRNRQVFQGIPRRRVLAGKELRLRQAVRPCPTEDRRGAPRPGQGRRWRPNDQLRDRRRESAGRSHRHGQVRVVPQALGHVPRQAPVPDLRGPLADLQGVFPGRQERDDEAGPGGPVRPVRRAKHILQEGLSGKRRALYFFLRIQDEGQGPAAPECGRDRQGQRR